MLQRVVIYCATTGQTTAVKAKSMWVCVGCGQRVNVIDTTQDAQKAA